MLHPKKIVFYCLNAIAMLLLCTACTQEQAVPVAIDFEIAIVNEDYSIPVTVKVLNKTVGADSYSWSFVGADRESSTDRNPGALVYTTLGEYTIRLDAANKDGSAESKEVTFNLDAAVEVAFDAEIQTNNFAPASVLITNNTKGATTYNWTFAGGTPETSTEEQPGTVVFNEPGDHLITLVVGNGKETHQLEKTITVADGLVADFDWEVAFQDDDLQIPVTLTMQNNSTGVLTYNWTFTNATPSTSTDENPTVTFTAEGTQTLTLTVSNGKESKSISKTIELLADTNIRSLTDVKFGINTAHNNNTIGAFYSATTREIYNKETLAAIDGSLIDIVLFGLGEDFSFNKFVSPDDLSTTTFPALANAQNTRIINSQEQCGCTTLLTVAQFDAITDDSVLNGLTVTETNGGSQHFTDATVPRIVLFTTADGRNGAIKIKEYVKDGQASYILTDIKIQKQ
ncbi:PKD domain-containing protein [Cellulophaga sp. 20_2_10]|uniref:PKD domain-containing protein n=1 Tax=Cellulophaga sp. 20_2_10 TaxID=2942476 RepID=UPI00201A99D4|nr:PKD domain-containing protein [Cellulophaga sp. 20_2_10]MCL5244260.1 PKD domain-containing protein [Cellulophaga sp. 20_2_10]